MLKIGDKAPDFNLPTGNGENISLSELRGKKVVLYFYPSDDTPTCTKEACAFQENLPSIKRKGVVVLGLSADTPKAHAKFAKKYSLNFPLLSDEKKDIIKAYGLWKKKSLFGVKFMGIERTTLIIDEEGTIRHIFSKVRVKGHVEKILAALDTLSFKKEPSL